MRTFTAVIPARSKLPPDLSLLLAPVHARAPSDPAAEVGRAEGLVLDEAGQVVAFIVRLSTRLVSTGPRTLLAASVVSIGDDGVLHPSWTEAELLSQPRLDDALHGVPAAGTAPIEIRSMNESIDVSSPPYPEATQDTLTGGAGGIAVGAALGAAFGIGAGAPVALGLATFFALGGGLVGALGGVMAPTATEEHDRMVDPRELAQTEASNAALRALEDRLRDPSLETADLVHLLRFSRSPASPSPEGLRASA